MKTGIPQTASLTACAHGLSVLFVAIIVRSFDGTVVEVVTTVAQYHSSGRCRLEDWYRSRVVQQRDLEQRELG